jgi:acetylornithine deacetylase/succinyl-diaminopimelate desuccinylase-like protein
VTRARPSHLTCSRPVTLTGRRTMTTREPSALIRSHRALASAGIPTLPAFGCGSLAVAHRPNEWIPAGDLTTAIDLTEALVRGYTTA